jgi:GR25 family glycosyltransferase involved in LPS biosynthesis
MSSSKNRLDSLDIKYDIFNGVDGSVLDQVWSKMNNPYFTNPSYIGCAISHLSIYQDAISCGYSKILIIEDDNLINKNIHTIFDSLDIPEWKDIFYLGYIPLNDDCSMWDYRFGINSNNVINSNLFRPSNLWGLFAYGLGIDLMKELIDVYQKEFPMEIDRYLVTEVQKRGNSLAIAPQLFCCQDDSFSDNLGFVPPNMREKSIDSRLANLDDYL